MREPLYEEMTPAQAADVLDAFIIERVPALEQLCSTMAEHGLDPNALLKATPEAVGPVWEWITSQAGRLGVDPRSLAEDPTRPSWPSWARNARLVDPHVTAIVPYGPEALVVNASDWDETRLKLWLTRHLAKARPLFGQSVGAFAVSGDLRRWGA